MRVVLFVGILGLVASCGLFSTYSGPNYDLLKNLSEKKSSKKSSTLNEREKEELRNEWKREVGLTESFALGRYEVRAYPLSEDYRQLMDLNLPENSSCFHAHLTVRSAYQKKALLPHWEGVAKDSENRLYQLYWIPESYQRTPVYEDVIGSSAGEKLWHQSGTLCTHGEVAFDQYFELVLKVKKLSFPFYGAKAKFVWNVPQLQENAEGEEVEVQRKKEVERYRGW